MPEAPLQPNPELQRFQDRVAAELQESIVQLLCRKTKHLLAIYAFGSRVQGQATASSDLDLAVLVAGKTDALQLWNLRGDLADCAGCEVDLLDFRTASTIMQAQILYGGERWWNKDSQADCFEAMVLSEKTELDTARAPLLQDIQKRGRIYGR